MVTPNIEIDVGKDKIVATAAPYRISMSNVEVEEPQKKTSSAQIEIPERKRQEAVDSDGSDYAFLANPKKLTAPKEIPVPEAEDKDKDTTDDGAHINRNHNSDSDSGRSRHSARTWKSHHSTHSHKSKRSERSEYRPRYSMPDDVRPGGSSAPPLVNSLFSSGLFSRRTHAMTEDDIRREKSYLLQQYQTKNRDELYSPKRFTMDSSLEEIQNELQFIVSKREMENSMSTWKQSFLFCADMIVQLNTTYDPFNFKVDLNDWAADLNYDVTRAGKYDEVLEELIMKWRGKMPMSPEMKLLFMMGTSLVFGVVNKKKEAALLAKRMDADRKMEQRIDAAVEKKFATKMREHLQQQQMATDQMRRHPPAAAGGGYRPMPPSMAAKVTRAEAPVRPQSPLQGPSLSRAELMKIMGSDIIESGDDDDDDTSSLSSESTLTSHEDDDTVVSVTMTNAPVISTPAANVKEEIPTTAAVKVTKPRTRKPAATKVKVTQEGNVDDGSDDGEMEVEVKKPAAKRAATTAGAPARARGRPRKNPLPNAVGLTLENF